MLKGDFGFSYRTRQPVAEMIASRIPATLELGVVALIISLLVGVPAGVYTRCSRAGSDTNHLDDDACGGFDPDVCDRDHVDLSSLACNWAGCRPSDAAGQCRLAVGKVRCLPLMAGARLLLPAITLGVYQLTLTMRLSAPR